MFWSRPESNKLINDKGEYNLIFHRKNKWITLKYILLDACGTITAIKWYFIVTIFVFMFVGSWVGFAMIWYLIAYFHGDLPKNAPQNDTEVTTHASAKPCVSGLNNFSGALFFSIDLQSTMGYGSLEIQDECPVAVALFVIQSYFGLVIQSLAGSLLLTKYLISKKKSKIPTWTIVFSEILRITKLPQEKPVEKTDRLVRRASMQKERLLKTIDENSNEIMSFKKFTRNPVRNKLVRSKVKPSQRFNKANEKLKDNYRLIFEISTLNTENLMSSNVSAFLLVKKKVNTPLGSSLEILATKSLDLSPDSIDHLANSDAKSTFTHTVDKNSPVSQFIDMILKKKTPIVLDKKSENSPNLVATVNKLHKSESQSSLFHSETSLNSEIIQLWPNETVSREKVELEIIAILQGIHIKNGEIIEMRTSYDVRDILLVE